MLCTFKLVAVFESEIAADERWGRKDEWNGKVWSKFHIQLNIPIAGVVIDSLHELTKVGEQLRNENVQEICGIFWMETTNNILNTVVSAFVKLWDFFEWKGWKQES